MNKELASRYRTLQNHSMVIKDKYMNNFEDRVKYENAIKDIRQVFRVCPFLCNIFQTLTTCFQTLQKPILFTAISNRRDMPCEKGTLTLSQTTNFRLFQTERVQTTILSLIKMAESYGNR